ncbi:MAG: chemotaxis protein CheW [Alcanivoracaceae bacterium]|nr:chemotaxis protein CheW [Alcanivoracaceae bacterium]
MAELPKEIPGLLIPMHGRPWVVPNIVVAEIIPLRQPDRPGHGPEWLLGWLSWRDQDIPLLSFERLNESGQVTIGPEARIAVINTVTGKLKFYAVIIQGIPRQSRIGKEDLVEEPVESGPADSMYVQMGGDLAVIPDLDAIEQALSGLMQ